MFYTVARNRIPLYAFLMAYALSFCSKTQCTLKSIDQLLQKLQWCTLPNIKIDENLDFVVDFSISLCKYNNIAFDFRIFHCKIWIHEKKNQPPTLMAIRILMHKRFSQVIFLNSLMTILHKNNWNYSCSSMCRFFITEEWSRR